MLTLRDLSAAVGDVRATHAPGALVLDAERDFESLPAPALDALATRAASLDPLSYPEAWVPPDAPDLLARIAGPDLVVGYPEHGTVTWTRQTDPPAAIVRPRAEGSPAAFVEFLIAEALVLAGGDDPEHFLGFFGDRYPDLAALAPGPADAYQLAAALYDAYRGLHTREVVAGWADDHPRLHGAWHDAGERLRPRLEDGAGSSVAEAAEFACSAVKHGLDLPAPFDALDAPAYREHGADYALEWAERTL